MLEQETLMNPMEAQRILEKWRQEYITLRLQSSLGNLTTQGFVRQSPLCQ